MALDRAIWKVGAIAIAAMVSSACTAEPVGHNRMKDKAIIGGPGEKNFAQRFNPGLRLPVDEQAFLDDLARLGLRYELFGARDSRKEIPPARHSRLDLTHIAKCYQIYGGVDQKKGVGAIYRAYVNDNGKIVYIENDFEYTGP